MLLSTDPLAALSYADLQRQHAALGAYLKTRVEIETLAGALNTLDERLAARAVCIQQRTQALSLLEATLTFDASPTAGAPLAPVASAVASAPPVTRPVAPPVAPPVVSAPIVSAPPVTRPAAPPVAPPVVAPPPVQQDLAPAPASTPAPPIVAPPPVAAPASLPEWAQKELTQPSAPDSLPEWAQSELSRPVTPDALPEWAQKEFPQPIAPPVPSAVAPPAELRRPPAPPRLVETPAEVGTLLHYRPNVLLAGGGPLGTVGEYSVAQCDPERGVMLADPSAPLRGVMLWLSDAEAGAETDAVLIAPALYQADAARAKVAATSRPELAEAGRVVTLIAGALWLQCRIEAAQADARGVFTALSLRVEAGEGEPPELPEAPEAAETPAPLSVPAPRAVAAEADEWD